MRRPLTIITIYIEEYCYAEELGFDVLALNEHHGNPFCMGGVMNVEASILARLTKRAKIVLIGNPLPTIKHPLRMAEELAEVDLPDPYEKTPGTVKVHAGASRVPVVDRDPLPSLGLQF